MFWKLAAGVSALICLPTVAYALGSIGTVSAPEIDAAAAASAMALLVSLGMVAYDKFKG